MAWFQEDTFIIFAFTLIITMLCAAGMGFLPVRRSSKKAKDTAMPAQPEKPDVTVITPPYKPSPRDALRAANIRRTAAARTRAENAAWDLDAGRSREETARANGYANVDSMRKALSRWGFKMPPQGKSK